MYIRYSRARFVSLFLFFGICPLSAHQQHRANNDRKFVIHFHLFLFSLCRLFLFLFPLSLSQKLSLLWMHEFLIDSIRIHIRGVFTSRCYTPMYILIYTLSFIVHCRCDCVCWCVFACVCSLFLLFIIPTSVGFFHLLSILFSTVCVCASSNHFFRHKISFHPFIAVFAWFVRVFEFVYLYIKDTMNKIDLRII